MDAAAIALCFITQCCGFCREVTVTVFPRIAARSAAESATSLVLTHEVENPAIRIEEIMHRIAILKDNLFMLNVFLMIGRMKSPTARNIPPRQSIYQISAGNPNRAACMNHPSVSADPELFPDFHEEFVQLSAIRRIRQVRFRIGIRQSRMQFLRASYQPLVG
jgi:hypothetical protein